MPVDGVPSAAVRSDDAVKRYMCGFQPEYGATGS